MARLRTWVFLLVFYLGTAAFVLATLVTMRLGERALLSNVHLWCRFHRACCRWLLGITSRFENLPPPGQYLFAAKHHAFYETFELVLALGDPVAVLKQELMAIPLWGAAARRYGVIEVDRDASAKALRAMMASAKAAKAAGRDVLIFPEGTRVPMGATPPLRSGFAGLYRVLDLPVVPVAIDSGRVWPKKGAKRAGVVTFRFGPPIAPGLGREAIEAEVHAAINALEG